MAETPSSSQLAPESFFKEKVAPQFSRRIDDLRRQILSLEQQVQDRLNAQGSVRVVVEGEGGGTWHLHVNKGEMTVTAESAFPPVTVYRPRPYFDWAISMADTGLRTKRTQQSGRTDESRLDA